MKQLMCIIHPSNACKIHEKRERDLKTKLIQFPDFLLFVCQLYFQHLLLSYSLLQILLFVAQSIISQRSSKLILMVEYSAMNTLLSCRSWISRSSIRFIHRSIKKRNSLKKREYVTKSVKTLSTNSIHQFNLL